MKKIAFVLIIIAVSISAFTYQDDKQGLARVRKIKGKEVYVNCEPLREYNVVGDVKTPKVAYGVTEGTKVIVILEIMINKAEKEKIEYDALLVNENNSLIKWK